jgi:uncharacterized protein YbjT (DUF2867 family)
MKVAITGGTGFVGRNVARLLIDAGHNVVLFARGVDSSSLSVRAWPRVRFTALGLDDAAKLAEALTSCDAVVHCAGINRELGAQTFRRVHIEGTRNVVEAARRTGVRKITLISFLRARANCGSAYHESKWAAEELVRNSGLDYTVLKCGVIYGPGDHLLNHLSHAFYTFPVFAFVGFRDKPIRPNAVEDVARIVKACVVDGAMARRTVAVLGPEELMTIPMVAISQVRMLQEGLAAAAEPCDPMPSELAPRIGFTEDQIRRGLPAPRPFGRSDLRCCGRLNGASRAHKHTVFFEFP